MVERDHNSLVPARKKALNGRVSAFSHKTTKKPTGETMEAAKLFLT
jgi:hypothetical protein